MVSSEKIRNIVITLILLSIIAVALPAVSAVYTIDISPLTVAPDQEVTVVLHDIPQDKIINMTITGKVAPTPGEEMTYELHNWSFPYESGMSSYQVEILNLTPGTPATVDVLREDGTEASYTGNVSDTGRFNASIIHELDKAQYNVSFMGTPQADEVQSTIDFSGLTRTWNTTKGSEPTAEAVTSTSRFTPSGLTDGMVQVKVFIDSVLQKTENITVSSKA